MPPRSSSPAKAPNPPRAKAHLVSDPAKRGTAEYAHRREIVAESIDKFVADNDELLEDLAK
jgi:hypothetical protein